VKAALERVAAFLADNREVHAREHVEQMQREVPEYFAGNDQAIVQLAVESTADWLHGMASGFRHGCRVPEAPPAIALKEALLTAQMGIPWRAVEKTIWVGYREILDRLFTDIQSAALPRAEEQALIVATHRFITTFCSELSSRLAHVYELERDSCVRRGEHRRIEVVKALLNGRAVSDAALGYALDGEHRAVVASGPDREDALNDLARTLDCALLVTPGIDGSAWGWLGGRPTITGAARALVGWEPPAGTQIAFGTIDRGPEGFVRSHAEAVEAHRVALRSGAPTTSYEDVAVDAFALRDERVARAFVLDELGTLADDDERAAELRKTLRAYFAAGNNGSAAAAMLGVHERTVSYRLNSIEDVIPAGIGRRRGELMLALRLHELLLCS
jgi:hypothetical protein